MSVRFAAILALSLIGPAAAADLDRPVFTPIPRAVPVAPPPLRVNDNIRPIIELDAFWIRLRECQTADEVGFQLDARYHGLPLTFQGIDPRIGAFRRVTVLRAYRRPEDEAIALPAVTFDIVTDGAPRSVTIPLWSGVKVYP